MTIFGRDLSDFFNNRKVKQLETEKQQLEEQVEEFNQEPPCKNRVSYNVNTRQIQVVTCDGNVYHGFDVEESLIERLKIATDEIIIQLLKPKQIVEEKTVNRAKVEEDRILSQHLDIFENTSAYEMIGNNVYFKGLTNIPIPSLVAMALAEALDQGTEEEYNSLKMWTLKLLLNPTEESREQALEYVRNFNIKLTNTGNMIMYRRIVSKGNSNKDLVEFISKSYLKVKGWKKNPSNYEVFDDNGLILAQGEKRHDYNNHQGNLRDLYNNLSNMKENRYTDDYTKSYDIRLGSVYKINDRDIDVNRNGSCGGALHVADGTVFNYSGFGNTPVCVLVNPMHIYKMDSGCSGKIGVREMFICAVTSQDEDGNYEDIDNQSLVNFDEIYHNESIAELEEALRNKSFNNLCVGDKISNLNLLDVNSIKTMLSSRVVSI